VEATTSPGLTYQGSPDKRLADLGSVEAIQLVAAFFCRSRSRFRRAGKEHSSYLYHFRCPIIPLLGFVRVSK
jgi:hypothetical protein